MAERAVLVKICGITRAGDAAAAVAAGADLLGLNFYPRSPRHVTTPAAREIVAAVRGSDARLVGVFVNQGADLIERTLDNLGLDLAQLHGDEPREAALALGRRAFPALRLDPGSLPESFPDFPEAYAVLIERQLDDGRYGGAGIPWAYAPLRLERRWFLAGGLRPENVAGAIRAAGPSGVDVASGVESAPGIKDSELMRRFVAAARHALS